MERLFFIVMIITFLVGCSKNETIPIISITDKTHEVISNQMNQDDDSLVWTEVQSNNHITVELSDSGEWSQQERTFLGEMIGSWLSEYTGEIINLTITDDDNQRKSDQEESFSIDLTGRTTYRSSSLISVVFQGMIHFKQTAHPNQVFFSVNFDPKTMKQVPFASLYEIDDELYQAFSKEGEQNILEENGGNWPENLDDFSNVFCSQEKFIQGLQEDCPLYDRVYYYYTEDGIGFSYSVIYAFGGHKEVELSRNTCLKMEN